MSTSYYPAYAPPWFVPYATDLSAYYDPAAAIWYSMCLGSRNGDSATFRQYLFKLASPYTAAAEVPIAIPVVHGILAPAAGRLYIFGQSTRDLFWQDGPYLAQTLTQKTIGLVKKSAPPFKVLSRAQHDVLPEQWPTLFEDAWKRAQR